MPRISQLPALTVPEANDEIAIVDASAATTKKITRADLLKGAALPADTVDTQAIADDAVTTAKIDLATLPLLAQATKQEITLNASGTFAAFGDIYYRDLGDFTWNTPFTQLISVSVIPKDNASANNQVWIAMNDADETGVKSVRQYRGSTTSVNTTHKIVGIGII